MLSSLIAAKVRGLSTLTNVTSVSFKLFSPEHFAFNRKLPISSNYDVILCPNNINNIISANPNDKYIDRAIFVIGNESRLYLENNICIPPYGINYYPVNDYCKVLFEKRTGEKITGKDILDIFKNSESK